MQGPSSIAMAQAGESAPYGLAGPPEMGGQADEHAPKRVRNSALDFTKGALVLFMVLYHWLNYFVSVQGFFYTYLRFVSGSFILITGFLITNTYRTSNRGRQSSVASRLLERGMRLLALFTVLNLFAHLIIRRNYNGSVFGLANFFSNAGAIYLNGKGESAAFDILVPIAYLLAVSGFAFLVLPRINYSIPLLCLIALVSIFILGAQGISSPNLNWLGVGLVGATLGMISMEKIDIVARRTFAVAGIYIGYAVLITFVGTPYAIQIVGAVLSVLTIYAVGKKIPGGSLLARHFILLGRYSLLGYIAQIAALQVLRRALAQAGSEELRLIASAFGAFALTSGTVLLTNYLKQTSKIANGAYRIAFG